MKFTKRSARREQARNKARAAAGSIPVGQYLASKEDLQKAFGELKIEIAEFRAAIEARFNDKSASLGSWDGGPEVRLWADYPRFAYQDRFFRLTLTFGCCGKTTLRAPPHEAPARRGQFASPKATAGSVTRFPLISSKASAVIRPPGGSVRTIKASVDSPEPGKYSSTNAAIFPCAGIVL